MLMEKEKYTQEEILLANNRLLSQINNKLLIIVLILVVPIIVAIIFWILFSMLLNQTSNEFNKINGSFKSSQYYK